MSVQAPIPVHAPLQPVNIEPGFGVGISVMTVPASMSEKQALPQEKPSGFEVTTPLPAPALTMRSDGVPVGGGGGPVAVKIAPTLVAAFMVTVQVPVPEQAPLQPAKVEPELATAVRVTLVPWAKVVLHVPPQLMPPGELVTAPVPVPLGATLNVNCGGGGAVPELKFAVATTAELIVSVQLPVPEQAPLQPVKVDPAFGVAMRVMTVLASRSEKQALPQSNPSGDEVIRPFPLPALVMVSDGELEGGAATVNAAPTLAAALSVTLQLPVPEHAPLQPVKVEPEAGVAVSDTNVP